MSHPPRSASVAKEWRKVWHVARFGQRGPPVVGGTTFMFRSAMRRKAAWRGEGRAERTGWSGRAAQQRFRSVGPPTRPVPDRPGSRQHPGARRAPRSQAICGRAVQPGGRRRRLAPLTRGRPGWPAPVGRDSRYRGRGPGFSLPCRVRSRSYGTVAPVGLREMGADAGAAKSRIQYVTNDRASQGKSPGCGVATRNPRALRWTLDLDYNGLIAPIERSFPRGSRSRDCANSRRSSVRTRPWPGYTIQPEHRLEQRAVVRRRRGSRPRTRREPGRGWGA
jgi:hypothetical protein